MPVPRDDDEMLIDVIAAGLHPRVRSQAAGSHFLGATGNAGQMAVQIAKLLGAKQIIAAGRADRGTFDIDARPIPLADVEQAWADAAHSTQRIVITPLS